MRRARVVLHSAPWMKNRLQEKKVRQAPNVATQDELVVLFTGTAQSMRTPLLSRLELPEDVAKKRVKLAECGSNHVVCAMEDGTVMSFGDNRKGQCGRPLAHGVYRDNDDEKEETTVAVFTRFSGEGPNVKSVAVGARHTFVFEKGTRNVWVTGQNELHQLGIRQTREVFTSDSRRDSSASVLLHSIMEPTDVSTSEDVAGQFGIFWEASGDIPAEEGGIRKISTSATHTLVLMESGSVYVFGCALDGQLGTGTTAARNTPYRLKFFSARKVAVLDVHSGHCCSFFVTDEGTFACGKLDEGRTGLPWSPSAPVKLLPTRVPSLPAGPHLASGLSHGTVVTDSGNWYAFGGSQKLGLTPPMCKDIADATPHYRGQRSYSNVHTPALVHDAEDSSLGDVPLSVLSSGYYHTIGLSGDGTVSGFGDTADGQLGANRPPDNRSRVIVHQNPDVATVAAGGNFSVIFINARQGVTPNTWSTLPVIRGF
ncbi:hypothetical protein DIPPA_65540 [Diplonema papillatum]|nr:hypothetical protein DIPPA_65540 [Diplonema papillatum]